MSSPPNRSPSDRDAFAEERIRMAEFQLRKRGIADQRVLDAMARVPRHDFVPPRYIDQAYEDHPLSIGEGQTISQPYIVALMLEALAIEPKDRVLEVGTGCGYVTALLAELAQEVISIERHAVLANAAQQVLARQSYKNVSVITGDGSEGYAPCSPYNAILVSAAALEIPSTLLSQLAEDGRLIIPVGSEDAQQLQLIQMKDGRPEIQLRELCRFVPLLPGVDE